MADEVDLAAAVAEDRTDRDWCAPFPYDLLNSMTDPLRGGILAPAAELLLSSSDMGPRAGK
jgi:hypothetical protein